MGIPVRACPVWCAAIPGHTSRFFRPARRTRLQEDDPVPLEIKTKLKMKRTAYQIKVGATLRLPYGTRAERRFTALLDTGEEVNAVIPRGEVLRNGDLVVVSDGRIVAIEAMPERVVLATFAKPEDQARAAYELGSRHVAVAMVDGGLCVAAGEETEQALAALGATLEAREAIFEPTLGAFQHAAPGDDDHVHDETCGHDHHHHHHGHDHKHDHGHKHGHDHDHGHDHAHDHKAAHGGHDHQHDHAHEHEHEHAGDDHGHDHAHDHRHGHDHQHDPKHDHKHGHKH